MISYRDKIRRAALIGFVFAASILDSTGFAAENPNDAFLESSPFREVAKNVFSSLEESDDPEVGNHVGIVEDGRDALLIRLHLIRHAKHAIDLQTFIWADDESARLIGNELLLAAQRGVKVRMLVDHLPLKIAPELVAFDAAILPNLEIKMYRPAAKRMRSSLFFRALETILPTGTNQRMHNKLLLIDGALGLTGGRNIGNEYFNLSTGYNFKDREALIIGPVVEAMTQSFNAYWNFKATIYNYELYDVARLIAKGDTRDLTALEDFEVLPMLAEVEGEANSAEIIHERFIEKLHEAGRVRFVADKPGKKTRFFYFARRNSGALSRAMWETVKKTEHELLLQSPYTILDRRSRGIFNERMKEVPGLRVMLSTNSFGAADHLTTYSANYRLRSKLIHGMELEVYEMKPHPEMLSEFLPNYGELKERAESEDLPRPPYLSIHAKTYVFDGRISFVGTYNLDPRSYYINSECGVFIEDKQISEDLRRRLLRDMAPENSYVIAKRKGPISKMSRPFEVISTSLPVDPWPIRSTSGFELLPGKEPLSTSDPEFYDRYLDLGSFPGSDGQFTEQTLTRMFKVFGKAATPLL